MTVSNGSIQSFNIVSSTVAVWTVKSNTSGNGTVTVSFAANKVTDLNGNGNSAATNVTWTYDNAGPTYDVSSPSVAECTT